MAHLSALSFISNIIYKGLWMEWDQITKIGLHVMDIKNQDCMRQPLTHA